MATKTVWPKNESTRRILKHTNGIGFPAQGAAIWPDDAFTRRRLRDGDVVLANPGINPVTKGLSLGPEYREIHSPTVTKTG